MITIILLYFFLFYHPKIETLVIRKTEASDLHRRLLFLMRGEIVSSSTI